MKKLLICGAAALCVFASCKKSEEKKVIGDWKVTVEGIDSNKNGTMDASEKEDVAGANVVYSFKKDGDMSMKTDIITVDGKWELKNDGDVLAITLLGITQDMNVTELTDTDLKLEYTFDGYKQFEELKKQ